MHIIIIYSSSSFWWWPPVCDNHHISSHRAALNSNTYYSNRIEIWINYKIMCIPVVDVYMQRNTIDFFTRGNNAYVLYICSCNISRPRNFGGTLWLQDDCDALIKFHNLYGIILQFIWWLLNYTLFRFGHLNQSEHVRWCIPKAVWLIFPLETLLSDKSPEMTGVGII